MDHADCPIPSSQWSHALIVSYCSSHSHESHTVRLAPKPLPCHCLATTMQKFLGISCLQSIDSPLATTAIFFGHHYQAWSTLPPPRRLKLNLVTISPSAIMLAIDAALQASSSLRVRLHSFQFKLMPPGWSYMQEEGQAKTEDAWWNDLSNSFYRRYDCWPWTGIWRLLSAKGLCNQLSASVDIN